MPKPQTRAEDQALSLRMALSAPSIPSAFGWSVTMKVGMHFDEHFFVCSARLPSRVVEGVELMVATRALLAVQARAGRATACLCRNLRTTIGVDIS